MYEIKTIDYNKKPERKVLVDGDVWTMRVLGAGTELKLSQAQRRQKQLKSKIESGQATDKDYDKYDEIESMMVTIFDTLFNDGTEDNKHIKKFIQDTPSEVMMNILVDIQEQFKENDKEIS